MIIIAHRGNRFGPNPSLENNPNYIKETIDAGFHVEVDVWYDRKTDNLWLGHDNPTYKISTDFLKHRNMWCHAKNIEALEYMTTNHIHCFWHESDRYTITNRGYFWCYPNNYSENGITVDLNDTVTSITCGVFGICTDIAEKWRNRYRLR
jgi:hypothetical protein